MNREDIDAYLALGVPPGASLLEIARARRRLAKQFHPDRAADPRAAERMREINRAWEILSERYRRSRFDGPTWRHADGWPMGADAGDPGHGARAATVAPPVDAVPSGRAAWLVLSGMLLVLTLILVAGLIAAADGPAMPAPYAPIQDNLGP